MADADVGEGNAGIRSWAADVSPGTNVLIAGPPMTGKRELMYRIVAGDRDPDDGRVFVSTRKSVDVVLQEYDDVHPGVDHDRVGVVDCVSSGRGDATVETAARRFANDPGDLTGIGIHLSEFLRQFHGDPQIRTARIGLHTLSTMLMYAELRRVYQFLHVVVRRIESSGYVGAFVVDEPADSPDLNTLAQPFDGLVEVRMADGPELRVRGIDPGPDDWTAF